MLGAAACQINDVVNKKAKDLHTKQLQGGPPTSYNWVYNSYN